MSLEDQLVYPLWYINHVLRILVLRLFEEEAIKAVIWTGCIELSMEYLLREEKGTCKKIKVYAKFQLRLGAVCPEHFIP